MLFQKTTSIIVLLWFMANTINAYELPPVVKLCDRTSSDLMECTSNAILTLKEFLVKGIAEKDIKTIDPMFIDHFEIVEKEGSENRLFNLNQKYSNVMVTGFGNFSIKDLKVDFINKCKLQVRAHMPRMEIYGDYLVDGRLMVFTIKGRGKANLTFTDVDLNLQLLCNYQKNDNNDDIFNVKNMQFILYPKKVYLNFENLFDGNPQLSATLSQFLNENSMIIFDELKAGYQKMFNKRFINISNKLLNDIPISKLFVK